jgi:hypothetical protein
MLNKFLIGILIFSINTLFSQNTRIYEPFQFENYKPMWVHAVIDSSIIGSFEEINWNGDSIFYDGFSHFYTNDIYKVDPVFYHEKLIVTELNNGPAAEGGFVQCIDIKTGNEIWNDYFDRRTDARKEYPRSAYINDHGQLEILGLRQNFKIPNTLPKPLWKHALMTIRKYNVESGELEERILTDENDPLAYKMITPFYLYVDAWLHSYLVKNGTNYQYILENGKLNSYIINDRSYVLDSSFVNFNTKYKEYSTRLFKVGQDKFFQLLYSGVENEANKKDSFELRYNLYNNKFELLKTKYLHEQIKKAYKYLKLYVDNDYFIILGEDYIVENGEAIPLITYSLFDIDGNLIEEVTLKDENGNPYAYNIQYGVAMKLPNEEGILIMVEIVEDGINKLGIFKSDGKGNLKIQKKIKILSSDHNITPLDLYLTNENDILLKAVDVNSKLTNDQNRGYATVYILFSAKDLDIKTSLQDITGLSVPAIYPNPSSNTISISCEDNPAGSIEIIDRLGRVMYKEKSTCCEEKSIDISGFNSGLYFVRLIDESGKIVGKGKFVKE